MLSRSVTKTKTVGRREETESSSSVTTFSLRSNENRDLREILEPGEFRERIYEREVSREQACGGVEYRERIREHEQIREGIHLGKIMYCLKCKSKTGTQNYHESVARNDTLMGKGNCINCGKKKSTTLR